MTPQRTWDPVPGGGSRLIRRRHQPDRQRGLGSRRRPGRAVGLEALESRHLLAEVVIAEVHYHPSGPSDLELAAGFQVADAFEFIELVNRADVPADLTRLKLVQTSIEGVAQGVAFDLASGNVTSLGPGERVVVAENLAAFTARYGNGLPVVGNWSGGLSDDGATLTLMDGNEVVQQFAFDDDWYASTDGAGFSLEIIDARQLDLSVWAQPQAWRPSVRIGGTPGIAADALPMPGDVNGDGRFNQQDLDRVLAAGKYGTDAPATFEQGDWNGDGWFDSHDIVFAMTHATFERDTVPQGTADIYQVAEDGQLAINAAGGVLANDRVDPGDEPTAHLLLAPAWGKLQLQPDGAFSYIPQRDFAGPDAFVYVPRVGNREGAATRVELDVRPINDPPTARGDFSFTRPATPLLVSAGEGVLANDLDVDSAALSVMPSTLPAHGTLQLAVDGAFSYTPHAGFRGMDRFTYRVSDGSLESELATVSISVNPQRVVVTELAAAVQNSFRDFDDDSSDWIEVTNFDTVPVDLQGWYLTDDANNLARWQVPVTTIIEPGQSRILVASGKNFVAPTGELHTDFRLSDQGEYLALVDPDGSSIVWDLFPVFPAQLEDISFGLAETTTTRSLVTASSPARVLLPDDDRWGREWTAMDFVDAAWAPATASVGYAAQLPASVVPGFSTRMLKVGGGRVWWIETTRVAESLLEGTAAPLDYFIEEDVTVVVPTVNFGGIQSVTPAGDFPEAIPYPDGTTFNTLNDFALRATATVTIPAGEWTIGFGSSDGGLLRLDGIPFLDTYGESGDAEITAGDSEIIFNEVRTRGWTTGTIRVPEGGVKTTLEAISFERRGADFLEIGIANGHTNSNPRTSRNWSLLSDGVLGWQVETDYVPTRPDFGPAFRSDLQPQMFDQHASAYLRIPFDVATVADVDRLELRLRYDDGFVAYLNGHEIVRDNVTGDATAISRADLDRHDADAQLPTVFDLTESIGHLRDGANVLAIHGLNADAGASGFLIEPELIAVNIHPAGPAFMSPTPAAINTIGRWGVLDPPRFSVESSSFREPFLLDLTPDDPRVTVRYTLDGSVPDDASQVFVAPLQILVTSQVRARSFLTDYLPSSTATELYLRVGQDLQDFNSNLPLLVFDTFGHEVPGTSSSLFAAGLGALYGLQESGRSSLGAQPELISRVGFKERGSSSASHPQKPYRIEFRQDQSDDDRDVELLGLPSDSDFALVPGYDVDRSLNRNPVIYDLSNQAGQYAARTRYVEVFVNSGRGELTRADYMGVYPLIETFKADPGRLDIGQLSPQYTTEPLVSGGYIFKIDRAAPGDTGLVVGPPSHQITFQMVEPAEEQLLQNPEQTAYLRDYLTDFITALVAPDFKHPESGLHYTEWVDVQSLVDHYLLYEFWQATDALFFSGHWFKPRDGKVHAGPIWDFDRAIGSLDGRNLDPRGWDVIGSAPFVWGRFFADLEFRQALIDRWADLQLDVLSLQNVFDTFDRITNPIAEGAARNFERWTAAPPRSGGGLFGVLDGTWEGEVLHMRMSVNVRHHWINSLFMSPPKFAAFLASDADTTMTVTLRGDLNQDQRIDATDLTLLSRAVVAGSNRADFELTGDAILDQADLRQMAQLLDTVPGDADLDGDVDADDQAIFVANLQRPPGGEPPTWLEADFDGDGDVDPDDGAVIAANFGFDRHEVAPVGKTIYYTTDGSDPRLPGGGISPLAIVFDGSLRVTGGTTIKARAYDPDFNIPERGFQQNVNDPESWSGLTTWIVTADVVTPDAALRVTEINYHPAAPTPVELASLPELTDEDFEFIKLVNISSQVVSLAAVRLSAGVEFDFADSSIRTLRPRESVVVVSNRAAYQLRYGTDQRIAGQYSGQLNNGGERLRLDHEDELVQEFAYSDRWFSETDGAGSFLQIINPANADLESWNDPASWRASG